MDYNLVFVLTLLILAEVDFELASPTIPQRSLRELVSKRRQLNYLKTILQDLDNKLEKLEKRSCPINIPGMDCDYGYIKGTGKDHNIWMSEIGPGKKRRKRLCAFNLPGMNCEFPEIVGIGKDTSAWNNGEGPGRKRSRDRYPPLLRNLL